MIGSEELAKLTGIESIDRCHIDPYLVWSALTGFRQFVDENNKLPGEIDFLVELDKPYDGKKGVVWPPEALTVGLWVPDEYACPLPGSLKTSRFITVRLCAQGKRPESVAPVVLSLLRSKGVKRVQIGFPRRPVHLDPTGPKVSEPPRWSGRRPKVILGLLDDTCPFGHPALSKSLHSTRVWSLWDQTDNENKQPPPPAHMGYGTELTQPMLEGLLQKWMNRGSVDEEALYQDGSAHQPRLRRRSSHAAAVAGLLAGRRSVLPTAPLNGNLPDAEADGVVPRLTEDEASEAPLVVVQFPNEELGVQLARWLSVRALDGLRYIARASAQIAGAGRPRLPLVVNISYGSVMGPHDGTAMLECAMDEVLVAHKQMAIVLAAGNLYGRQRAEEEKALERRASGRHAQATLPARGSSARFGFYVPPDKSIESHLEVWVGRESTKTKKLSLLGPKDVEVSLTPPDGSGLPRVTVSCSGMMHLGPVGGVPIYGLFVLRKAAQSTVQSLVSLTVAPTQAGEAQAVAPAGVWILEIVSTCDRNLNLDAWVERDILPNKARRQQAARLVELQYSDAATLTDENTLNNIATGGQTFRVGALEARRDADGNLRVSSYSSQPADDSMGLEFSAVADTSAVLPGIRVSGSTGGTVLRMNGTSVAAPQAARWIAHKLATRRKKLGVIRKEALNPPLPPKKPVPPGSSGRLQPGPRDTRRRGKLSV